MVDPMTALNRRPAHFPLLSLPSEIIIRISAFWAGSRLGLPTSAFNTELAAPQPTCDRRTRPPPLEVPD
ncbi:hypothetical protein M427DRAFT_70693 [Gonapodya prolifera JEL478]|uniref:Uncharacterized protein n=1 Tax=Gonapodya prolifera (strain JEL478) TaxID=1344416 RepID=A0A139ACU2_GONPJ|nr:hypothetical protein M427DRAFT_70693 [Gonapodya prolifera JEL478]|eukprot:KXS14489.1 hypothetical protein M427DRAFT_70693 [Gonapodya prolifera JEL478]